MSAAIETLLPHRAPMRFIDALVSYTDAEAVATACFAEKKFATADGKVLESALVECLAQTAAAALGQWAKDKGDSGNAAPGMLVAVSSFKIESRPPLEKDLRIEIVERKRLGPMRMISGNIFCDGEIIASGNLSVYA